MKTKFFIFGCLTIAIALSMMLSCKKNDNPTQVPTSAKKVLPALGLDVDPASCQTLSIITLGSSTTIYWCDGEPSTCLCTVTVHGSTFQTFKTAVAGGPSAIATFFSNTTNAENTWPVLNTSQGYSCDSALCSGNFSITIQNNAAISDTLPAGFLCIVKQASTGNAVFAMPCDTN